MTYSDFLNSLANNREFSFFDGTDTWTFKSEQKEVEIGGHHFIVIAQSDNIELANFIENSSESPKLFLIEEGDATFFALSIAELFHRKKLLKIYTELRKGKLREYEKFLNQFEDCSGCLYWIASGLMTTEYDEERYDPERNKIAAEILRKAAEKDDPRACSELARYYVWEEEDREVEFYWRLRATKLGDMFEKKRFADYIIDERNDKIDLALEILHQMKAKNFDVAWANWKEANIYLKGKGKEVDFTRGVELLQSAVRDNWPPAMADMSYFLYHGTGDIAADKETAIALLEKANTLSNQQYAGILKKLQNE